MKRRDFLATAGKSTAGAFFAGNGIMRGVEDWARAAESAKPNIILILADDLGYNDLGIQGCTDIPTPHMDSIGRNGVRFTQGYVSCPLCAPSRAGLMTGRYQQRFGFEHNPGPEIQAADDFGLPLTEPTIAERLKKLGYATGMIGKWHLGFKSEFQPVKRGFDEFFGFLSGAHPYMPGTSSRQNPILRGSTPVEEKEYLTDAFAREAVSFVDRHKTGPFFLYLPFNAVHAPLEAAEKYLARFKNIRDTRRRTHAAMLSALDDAVGAVIGRVRMAGLEEKTLVILLGDNGGPTAQTTSSNAPLRGFKAQVLEGGIRIPFLIQWKNRIPAGKVETRSVISLDIHPTAVAAASAAIDPAWKLDGANLLPYLTDGRSGMPHEALYWRMEPQWAVRHGDLKLVSTGTEKEALFDLSGDPDESKTLANGRPEDVRKLKSLYDEWNSQLQAPKWRRQGAGAAARRQLLNPGANLGPAQIQRQFNALDADKDGKLTPQEFARPRIFKRIDADGSGTLTLEEVRKYLSRRRP